MRFTEKEIYHVYNRGNNHQRIFFSDADYLYFLKKVRAEWWPVCEILAWCLMPNHFHFMLMATTASSTEIPCYGGRPMQMLARKIGLTLSSYAQYINRQKNSSGSLFQQKTKAKCLSDQPIYQTAAAGPTINTSSYFINCMHYIHQNPLQAGLVDKMENWVYSSFVDYTSLRKGNLCNKNLFYRYTGYDENHFYRDSYNLLDNDNMNYVW
jgi:putative transposase